MNVHACIADGGRSSGWKHYQSNRFCSFVAVWARFRFMESNYRLVRQSGSRCSNPQYLIMFSVECPPFHIFGHSSGGWGRESRWEFTLDAKVVL